MFVQKGTRRGMSFVIVAMPLRSAETLSGTVEPALLFQYGEMSLTSVV